MKKEKSLGKSRKLSFLSKKRRGKKTGPSSMGTLDEAELIVNSKTPEEEKKHPIDISKEDPLEEERTSLLSNISTLKDKVRGEGEHHVGNADSLAALEGLWREAMPSMVDSLVVPEVEDTEGEAEYLSRFISDKLDSIVAKGFKPVYSGHDIVKAVYEKQELVFDELIYDITETMIDSVMNEARKKEESAALVFDEFVFLSIARIDFGICSETFRYAFENNKNIHVSFLSRDLYEETISVLDKNHDINSIDVLTQLFFESFRKNKDVRENINTPPPESILKIEV